MKESLKFVVLAKQGILTGMDRVFFAYLRPVNEVTCLVGELREKHTLYPAISFPERAKGVDLAKAVCGLLDKEFLCQTSQIVVLLELAKDDTGLLIEILDVT